MIRFATVTSLVIPCLRFFAHTEPFDGRFRNHSTIMVSYHRHGSLLNLLAKT